MVADFKNKYNFLKDKFWQNFIQENYKKPIDKVLFALNKNKEIDIPTLANQLKGKNIAETKIPSWNEFENLIFPSQISMEQCSSELIANYKSKLVKGKSCIDITGGLGVDSFFLSQSFEKTYHLEKNKELQFIVQNNFKALSSSIQSIAADGVDYLKSTKETYDLIYIDPSRRNIHNKKVVQLEDYSPNILEHIDLLLHKGKRLLIKTAPLLDIKRVLMQIPQVKEVHVVALNNDCKELLFLLDSKITDKPPTIHCKDLIKNIDFTFDYNQEKQCLNNFSQPLKYLYEPNVSILKGGAFKVISTQFNIYKLHPSSHLYTSKKRIKSFPGRCFEIIANCGLNKKELQHYIENKKANITRRNFPISVNEIRRKTGIKEGGNDYLFATTLLDESKRVLICQKC